MINLKEQKMEGDVMESYETWTDQVIGKIRNKMEWVGEKNKGRIPYTTDESGNYDNKADPETEWNRDDGLCWWTNGFWGGIMWLLYQDTRDDRYAEIARISEHQLEGCFEKFYGLHHDVGFMFLPTAVADYRLTKNARSRKIGLHAANLLAGRFNPAGRFIRAWNDVEDKDTRGWRLLTVCSISRSFIGRRRKRRTRDTVISP